MSDRATFTTDFIYHPETAERVAAFFTDWLDHAPLVSKHFISGWTRTMDGNTHEWDDIMEELAKVLKSTDQVQIVAVFESSEVRSHIFRENKVRIDSIPVMGRMAVREALIQSIGSDLERTLNKGGPNISLGDLVDRALDSIPTMELV